MEELKTEKSKTNIFVNLRVPDYLKSGSKNVATKASMTFYLFI